MKILKNAFFMFIFFCMSNLLAADIVELDSSVPSSFLELIDAFEADTVLYADLQNELRDAYAQFDESAHERRHLYCCIKYKFDLLIQEFQKKEQDLRAQIGERDQTISDWQERYELLKVETADEMDALYTVIEMLALQLDSRENRDPIYLMADDISMLLQDVMDRYLALQEQRDNCIALIKKLSEKIDGHFEIEVIENAILGEQICGILYCPELNELDELEDGFVDNPSEMVEGEIQHYELTNEIDQVDEVQSLVLDEIEADEIF